VTVPSSLLAIAKPVEERLQALLDAERARWRAVDPELVPPLDVLAELILARGKRLRPAFCHWAFVGAGGDAGDPLLVDAGAALELLHGMALVHDDVMDGSDRRRGVDTAHRPPARGGGVAG
jgi:geranylgeranyl diphosphate synthase, type I